MANGTRSISPKTLSDEVKRAIAQIDALRGANPAPGVITVPPWLIGFILRGDLQARPGDLEKLATQAARALPSAQGASPAALINNGRIIIGFIQDFAVTTLAE